MDGSGFPCPYGKGNVSTGIVGVDPGQQRHALNIEITLEDCSGPFANPHHAMPLWLLVPEKLGHLEVVELGILMETPH